MVLVNICQTENGRKTLRDVKLIILYIILLGLRILSFLTNKRCITFNMCFYIGNIILYYLLNLSKLDTHDFTRKVRHRCATEKNTQTTNRERRRKGRSING